MVCLVYHYILLDGDCSMHICPVCNSPSPTVVCSVCGFDDSRNYTGHPTFFNLYNLPKSAFQTVSASTTFFRCSACKGVHFLVDTQSSKLICAKCRAATDVQTIFPTGRRVRPAITSLPSTPPDYIRSEAAHREWLKSLQSQGD